MTRTQQRQDGEAGQNAPASLPGLVEGKNATMSARQFKSVTVAELIEVLQEQDQEALVTFASDYGDHCHTEQVHALEGDIQEVGLRESAYSDSGWAVVGEESDTEPTCKVLRIS